MPSVFLSRSRTPPHTVGMRNKQRGKWRNRRSKSEPKSQQASEQSDATMEYRCVQCGFRIKTLYVQYSPGNIRLMKCVNCKAVADEYIECEIMILLIDLMLHKCKAYRHLLFNVLNQKDYKFEGLFWKLAASFLLLDAYKSFLLERSKDEFVSSSVSSQVSICWKMLIDVFFGNLMFLLTFLFATRISIVTAISFSSSTESDDRVDYESMCWGLRLCPRCKSICHSVDSAQIVGALMKCRLNCPPHCL